MADAVGRTQSKWAALGIAITHAKGGLAPFPDPDRNTWYAASPSEIEELAAGRETDLTRSRAAPR